MPASMKYSRKIRKYLKENKNQKKLLKSRKILHSLECIQDSKIILLKESDEISHHLGDILYRLNKSY